MFSSWLPKETDFFAYFERVAALTTESAREFVLFCSGNGSSAPHADRIRELEHEADEATHGCIDSLHRTFITPIDRGDIHRLVKRLDDVLDDIHRAAWHMVLYDLREIRSEASDLAAILVRGSMEIEQALKLLRSTKNAAQIQEKCRLVYAIEAEADAKVRAGLARLFHEEKDAVLIMKWKEIFDVLEKAANRCEDVANVIEGILIEAS